MGFTNNEVVSKYQYQKEETITTSLQKGLKNFIKARIVGLAIICRSYWLNHRAWKVKTIFLSVPADFMGMVGGDQPGFSGDFNEPVSSTGKL